MAPAGDDGLYPPPDAPAVDTRSRRWRTVALQVALGGAAGFAFAAGGGFALGRLLPRMPDWIAVPSPGWLLAAAVLALWPNILLHEAGHVLAGLSRGMRALAFGVGPLRWERGLDGWRFRRAARVAGIGGFASLLPDGDRGASRGDQFAYLLGGPGANLLTAAACLALLPLAAGSRAATGALLGVAACAAVLGLVNLLPFHVQGWRSDGRVLVDLLRGNPDAMLQLRIQRLLALTMAGVRPRDWPLQALPDAPAPTASQVLGLNAWLLRLSWAMDAGDAAEAARVARGATAGWPTLPAAFRPHLAILLAWHAARLRRDPRLLEAWRPHCEGGIVDLSLLRAWLDAERAAFAGDAAATAARIDAARALLGRAPDPVTALQLREFLDAPAATLPPRLPSAG